MIIGSVKAKNFMRYRKFNKNFIDRDVVAIIGPNQGGKSNIIEMITYALTGSTRAEKETELIHYGEDTMYVQVTLKEGDKKYTIKRGRDIKGNGILEVDWIDKSKNAQQEIYNLIGSERDELFKTTIFKQTEINELMDMKPSEKEKFLMKWFDFKHFENAEKLAKERLSEQNKKRTEIKSKRDYLREKVNNDIDFESDIELQETARNNYTERKTEVENKIRELEKNSTMTVSEYRSLAAQFKKEKDEFERDKQKLSSLQCEIEKSHDLVKAIKAKESKLTSSLPERDDIKEKIFKKSEQIRTLKEKTIIMKKHGNGVCPILNEECDRIKATKEDIHKLEKSISDSSIKLSELNNVLADIDNQNNLIGDISNLKNRLKVLLAKKGEISTLEEKISNKKTRLTEMADKLKSFDRNIPNQIEDFKSELSEINSKLSNITQELSDIKAKKRLYEENKETIKKFTSQIKKIDIQIDKLKYIAMMFGKDGIPSQQIENGFQEIEDEANFILSRMNDMEVIFKPYKETSTKESFCASCGFVFPKGYRKGDCAECGSDRGNKKKNQINFEVFKRGRKYPFHMDSVGGKTLISTAIRTALTQFSKRNNRCFLDTIFMDEPDTALDDDNTKLFFDLVTKVFIDILGIKQVFWISHNREIKGNLNHVISVEDKGDYSEAEWVQ